MLYKLTGVILFSLLAFEEISAQEKLKEHNLVIGGAMRFNYLYKSWDDVNKRKGGEIAYDMFRINVDDEYKKVLLSSEIRFYSSDFGGMLIHHAYTGYKINEMSEIHLGITKVPFGIQPYASHNWFFNLHYYLGLEDDYDAGIKYIHAGEKLDLQVAFFKNSELPSSNYARYSYDVVGSHEEINKFNVRLAHKSKYIEVGASGQYGQLLNTKDYSLGDHNAAAGHINAQFNKWNVMLQVISFDHNPSDSNTSTVQMAAYNAAYDVASTGMMYSLGIQYSIPLELGPITKLNLYDNVGFLDKSNRNFNDTYMNVLGFSVAIGKLFVYCDMASGINHPWLGNEYSVALAEGNDRREINTRYNVNFGYYF